LAGALPRRDWAWKASDTLCAGNGIAVVLRAAASGKLKSGALVELLPDLRIPDFWLKALVPATRSNLVRVQTLLASIREAFQSAGALRESFR
jgi:DNA-binding transcriptional LysR family regulator